MFSKSKPFKFSRSGTKLACGLLCWVFAMIVIRQALANYHFDHPQDSQAVHEREELHSKLLSNPISSAHLRYCNTNGTYFDTNWSCPSNHYYLEQLIVINRHGTRESVNTGAANWNEHCKSKKEKICTYTYTYIIKRAIKSNGLDLHAASSYRKDKQHLCLTKAGLVQVRSVASHVKRYSALCHGDFVNVIQASQTALLSSSANRAFDTVAEFVQVFLGSGMYRISIAEPAGDIFQPWLVCSRRNATNLIGWINHQLSKAKLWETFSVGRKHLCDTIQTKLTSKDCLDLTENVMMPICNEMNNLTLGLDSTQIEAMFQMYEEFHEHLFKSPKASITAKKLVAPMLHKIREIIGKKHEFKLVIIGAHDFTLAHFFASLNMDNWHWPFLASNTLIEVLRDVRTNQIFLRFLQDGKVLSEMSLLLFEMATNWAIPLRSWTCPQLYRVSKT
ncbi:hypothetical protein RFI_10504 [Reticulomyxa filosa]|uniref:Uncharacterized protein n=1 Tax=Reticulomyxa filosa TaxID=46433 RepID=X6NJZ2_RETFI|nr:hypothetical protein RFI_10504 [Reticulomyxa filosa]|eukprot:ETO26630.1 hypothetical protein RFI_10504 [Reticulomyxa filosa]